MKNVLEVVEASLPVKRKRLQSGWISFNCPACVAMGEARPDTRGRGGIYFSETGGIAYSCFNCKLKTRWEPGFGFSKKFQFLLTQLGLSDYEIKELSFSIWLHNKQENKQENNGQTIEIPNQNYFVFSEEQLPDGAKPFNYWLNEKNPHEKFLKVAEYILNRGDSFIKYYNYYWTPLNKEWMSSRVIIPFYWKDKIVGYTARLAIPTLHASRYYGYVQDNYIFNNNVLEKNRKYVILVEGVFDAIAVDGISVLGSTITDKQIKWINSHDLDVIFVPDRDKATLPLVNTALERGWYVALPEWDFKVKDVADAVGSYGRVFTLREIIRTKLDSIMKIKQRIVSYIGK